MKPKTCGAKPRCDEDHQRSLDGASPQDAEALCSADPTCGGESDSELTDSETVGEAKGGKEGRKNGLVWVGSGWLGVAAWVGVDLQIAKLPPMLLQLCFSKLPALSRSVVNSYQS